MTQSQLIDLLVARLFRDHGKSKHHCRRLTGVVRIYSEQTHPHCNWAIDPIGTHTEIKLFERLIDDMRQAHPVVQDDR